MLVLLYGFFTLAAGARSGVQIATKFSQAPLAYLLSALAAAVYASGGILKALADRDPAYRIWAGWLCRAELTGVIAVGSASVLAPAAFPDATVWSFYGLGYGFVPLLLPLLALLWVRHSV